MKNKTLTPILLAVIFFLMLGLSFAAVPLYDIFCRVTGFGGTTQISKEAPLIVLDQKVSVRFDTNVNTLPWNFKAKTNVMDVKIGQVNQIEFEVENYEDSKVENKDRSVDSFVEWIKMKSREKKQGGSKTRRKRKNKRGGKWSAKYKRSINCKRPKGFSQRQYCKYGRKK